VTVLDAQFVVVDEVTYGTPVTVSRFFEVESIPGFKPDVMTVSSKGHRAGVYTRVKGTHRRVVVGASGPVTFPVPTLGFGWWLKHMMGAVATGAAVDSNYTHTGTIASLSGDFFTAQVGRPRVPSGTVQPFTYHGGKITSWELSMDADDQLMFTANCDFEDVDTATALATASYPSGATIFDFMGAVITIGGVNAEITNFKVGMDNHLNTGRRFLSSRLKKEPDTAGVPEVTWSGDLEFTSNAHYDKFVDADAADNYAAIVATFTGPVAHAGTTLPTLVVTIPEARFDDHSFSTGFDSEMTQSVSGTADTPTAGGSALTVAYTTAQATP
jgi:hypothetical protein